MNRFIDIPANRALISATLALLSVSLPHIARAQNAPAQSPDAARSPTAPASETPTLPGDSAVPPQAPPAATVEVPAATAPAADVAAAPTAADAATEAAARAAMQEVETQADAQMEEYKLNIYGFADFAFGATLNDSTLQASGSTFMVGNFNLYAGADLGSNFRTLTEVRFLYTPNGSTPPAPRGAPPPTDRTNTEVADYADVQATMKWGGISIQRAYVEYTASSWLNLRGGQFLTPYGIWNVDHGSPVIIGVRRPYMIGIGVIPNQQTGLEVYGSGLVGPVELGYHLTVSNGRGPIDTYADLDGNKAVGGRLFVRHHSDLGDITLGTSAYRGKYTDNKRVMSFAADGIHVTYPITAQYDEFSWAGDLKWERGGFLLQSEVMMGQIAHNDAVRPAAIPDPAVPPGVQPDFTRGGFYALTGYRFPFLGTMPWVGGEHYSFGKQDGIPSVGAVMGGLNVRPTGRVVVKAQYTHVIFPEKSLGTNITPIDLLDCQVAWSF